MQQSCYGLLWAAVNAAIAHNAVVVMDNSPIPAFKVFHRADLGTIIAIIYVIILVFALSMPSWLESVPGFSYSFNESLF